MLFTTLPRIYSGQFSADPPQGDVALRVFSDAARGQSVTHLFQEGDLVQHGKKLPGGGALGADGFVKPGYKVVVAIETVGCQSAEQGGIGQGHLVLERVFFCTNTGTSY